MGEFTTLMGISQEIINTKTLNTYSMQHEFINWLGERILNESGTRYSVEVNFRTQWKEAKDHFVKLVLGYIMAAMKQHNYHVKHVYTVKPYRILISTKNWEDGEWVGVVSFNEEHDCFVYSEGVYHKLRGTCSIAKESPVKCAGTSAAEISKEVFNKIDHLKSKHPRDGYKLKPAEKKRGPQS